MIATGDSRLQKRPAQQQLRTRKLVVKLASHPEKPTNPHFSILALIAFIASFAIARTFTTFYPSIVIVTASGIHIHHFWYGLILLAVGGWLGIINQTERIDQLAAVLYGAGGGLIADEFGLLLTFGDYWTNLTYSIVGMFLAFLFLVGLLVEHRGEVRAQFGRFSKSDAIFYGGVFLGMVSVAFLTTTSSPLIMVISGVLAIVSVAMILIHVIYWISLRSKTRGKTIVRRTK